MEYIRLGILVLILLIMAGCAVDKMVFPCRKSYSSLDGVVKLAVDKGVNVAVLYNANPASEYTVLFCHGNYEDLGTLSDFLKIYQQAGFSVLAWDYRGYGISDGKPTETNVNSDIRKIFAYMTDELSIDPKKIIIHGRSVGTGPACDLAADTDCGGLIIESGFKSIYSTRIPWVGLWGDRFMNIRKIADVKCPKLFIHGKLDRIVPFTHAEKMYQTAPEPKAKLWIDTAGHNDILWLAEDKYWQAIKEFSKTVN